MMLLLSCRLCALGCGLFSCSHDASVVLQALCSGLSLSCSDDAPVVL